LTAPAAALATATLALPAATTLSRRRSALLRERRHGQQ
jgi:hypothetical protein